MSLIDLDAAGEGKPAGEGVEWFRFKGEVYRLPDPVPGWLTLGMLHQYRVSALTAGPWLLDQLLDAETFEALVGHRALTQEQLDQVISAATVHVLGMVERTEPAPAPEPALVSANGAGPRPTRPRKGGGKTG